MWSAQEMKYHINILDLLAVKLTIQTFTKYRGVKAIHLQVDNIVALTYLVKMDEGDGGAGGIQNLKMVELAKEIWEYLSKYGITITAEYLPSELNVAADWKSRNNLHCMETRSSLSCNRCISTELGTQIPACLSPILHDSKSSQQNTQ